MSIEQAFNFVAISPQLTTSGLPTIEQLAGVEAEGYQVVINLLPDENEYAVEGERETLEAQNLDYVYIPVDYALPNIDDYRLFEKTMDGLNGRRTHIHCAANYRVAVFYGLYAHRSGLWSKERMNEHIRSLFNTEDYPPWPEFIENTAQLKSLE